jgi:hypothetical protein
MASSYSTDLKLELMVTGENSGTWGDKTNSNLNLLQQAIAGYQAIALTSTNTTLAMSNATISDARNAVIKFTGTIAANTTVFVDSGIEKTYIIENGTSGAFTLALNQVGGNSVIFGAADKTSKIVYLDGTNANDLGVVNLIAPQTLTNKTLTSPVINEIDDANGNEEIKFTATASAVNEFTVANAAAGSAPEISASGNDTNIDIKITPKGTGKVNIDGIKYPNTDGSAGQLLSTDGSGNLSFITVSSEAQFIAGSLPLATNKSTTARNAVSISKATGEVGSYPILNVYSSVAAKTVTTTATVQYSLDGSYGIIVGATNATTASLTGVFTPSNGTPVIGNTSVLISNLTGNPGNQAFGYGIGLYKVASDIFMCDAISGDLSGADWQAGSRFFTARVNTSGAISIGNITTFSSGGLGAFQRVGIVNQMNVTTYSTGSGSGVTTNAKVLTLDTNLTTINRLSTNQSVVNFNVGGSYYNFGNLGDTYYYVTNSSVVFATLNATTRLVSVPITQSINTNFYLSTATWYKVSNTRWLADYQNATTLAREIATFNVNATTLAFSSINSTTRLYSGMFRFLGTTAAVVDISTNLTTAVLSYAAGLGFNQNTLELSTNGEIKGYNVGTYLGIAGVNPYDYNIDPNTSNEIVVAFLNTSSQYKDLIVNAASTDQFNYAGIATANDTTSPTTIIQDGIQDGYTGLLIGSTYYVNFDGTLSTVATNITAGVAVTSTQLQVRQVNI